MASIYQVLQLLATRACGFVVARQHVNIAFVVVSFLWPSCFLWHCTMYNMQSEAHSTPQSAEHYILATHTSRNLPQPELSKLMC